MFQLNSEDLAGTRFQIGTAYSSRNKRHIPYVFTENGVAMLSGILNSERAISVNISIMRTFTKMRTLLLNDEILSKRLLELEKDTNKVFRFVFERLDLVETEISDLRKEKPTLSPKRKKIGLKKD
jgi:hypothetical protein